MSPHPDLDVIASGERRFYAVFEASPDCVKLVNAEGRLIDINAAGLRMIEADCADELRGKSLFDLIDPAYHQSFRDGVAAVFAGKTIQIQFEVVSLRGRRLFMDQTAAPLFADDDPMQVVEMVAVTRNVSAERQAEADLLQARLAQEVMRSAAHHAAILGQKLKTPLDAIVGNSEMLLEAAQEQGREREAADAQRVLDAASELGLLVNQLLATALAEARQHVQARDVDDFLEAVAAAAKPLAEANGNRIRLQIDPRCVFLPPHEDMLSQCLQALLSQAISHTHDGLITIRARPMLGGGAPRVVLSVIDNGAGLTPHELKALFEAGPDAQAPSGAEPESTLSGLAAARKLARFMGGDITAASAPGRGSRLTITVPNPGLLDSSSSRRSV
jgi:PAS domain S-box-containing protein